ncbi:MAG: acetyl ornithine aminotransferase family protein [Deinococcales bacterium]
MNHSNSKVILERYADSMSTSNAVSFPMVVSHGEGCWLFDVDGNKYLDMMAGIAVNTTGYAHPAIVKAVQEQATKVQHTCFAVFATEPQVVLAERLRQHVGEEYRVFFGNSGTEGIEAAMKLARYHTKRPYFIAFTGSFHGRSMGALSLTASISKYRKGFGNLVPGVFHVPYPQPYRYPRSAEMTQEHLEYLFKYTTPPEEVAAIVVEPIQGEGGYIVPPDGFMQTLRKVCDQYGILLIADEVQTGVGRTGQFLACEHDGVKPDIVVLAKGLASGYPISAVMFKNEVSTWGPGAHGTTFGGNPVSSAAALATLDVLEAGTMENARVQGNYLLERMKALQQKAPALGDVRGRGLMVGLEFVKNGKEENPALRDRIQKLALEQGLILLGAGSNAIRLAPPLVLTPEDAKFAADTIERVTLDAIAQD